MIFSIITEYYLYRVFRSWPFLLVGLVLSVTGTSRVSAETVALTEVRVGNHGAYIRIVFALSSQVHYLLDDDARAGSISIRFLDTITKVSENSAPATSGCLDQVTTVQQDDQVVAFLRIKPGWNKLNPFVLREPDRMILDIFCGEVSSTVQLQNDLQSNQAAPFKEAAREKKSDAVETIFSLKDPPPVETETAPSVATKLPVLISTAPSAVVTESLPQRSRPKTDQAAEPVASTTVAPEKKDPFQKYLFILLASITGIIIVLIALIMIQKKSISVGSNAVMDNTLADPDETLRAIDSQIKAKLMKYDDE